MGIKHGVASALVGVVTLSSIGCGCGCGSSKPQPIEEPAAKSAPTMALDVTFGIRQQDTVEVTDHDSLFALVTPLRSSATSTSRPFCTATPLGLRTLLTAAHCIAQDRVAYAGPSLVGQSDFMRACEGHPCSQAPAEPESGADSEFTRNDLGTAVLDANAPSLSPKPLTLIDVANETELGSVYLVSTNRPHPLLVCRIRILDGEGSARGTVELGDSGSPLVILSNAPQPEAGVIGVVSRRIAGAGAWFFSPLEEELPWPQFDPEPQRDLEDLTFSISEDPRCN